MEKVQEQIQLCIQSKRKKKRVITIFSVFLVIFYTLFVYVKDVSGTRRGWFNDDFIATLQTILISFLTLLFSVVLIYMMWQFKQSKSTKLDITKIFLHWFFVLIDQVDQICLLILMKRCACWHGSFELFMTLSRWWLVLLI